MFKAASGIMINMVVSRIIAIHINFFINRNLVFHDRRVCPFTIVTYFLVAAVIGMLAYFIIQRVNQYYRINVIVARLATEMTPF